MREELTAFFLELTRHEIGAKSDRGVSLLIRIINDIAELSGQCLGVSLLIEKSVRKNRIIKHKEMEALDPFIVMVENFLNFLERQFDGKTSDEDKKYAEDLEQRINKSRDKLRKMGQKRIQAGKDVKTELLFIDLVKRIENLADNCYSISKALSALKK
jgi:phosphate:Na+ symporter